MLVKHRLQKYSQIMVAVRKRSVVCSSVRVSDVYVYQRLVLLGNLRVYDNLFCYFCADRAMERHAKHRLSRTADLKLEEKTGHSVAIDLLLCILRMEAQLWCTSTVYWRQRL